FCYTLNYPLSKHDLKDLKERCNEQSWEQGLHVPEKGKTFAGEADREYGRYQRTYPGTETDREQPQPNSKEV
ncbi:hypothetical protein ACM5RN_001973, partial [Campylobacter coli]